MRSYVTEKATTDKLAATLNEVIEHHPNVETVQWVGGRDWIVVAYREDALAFNEPGWVEANVQSHARYDAHVAEHGQLPADIHPAFPYTLIDAEVEWGDIAYGRYDEGRLPAGFEFTGWIEDRARSWIIFLGAHGAPALYWPRRDEGGGVIGQPIALGG